MSSAPDWKRTSANTGTVHSLTTSTISLKILIYDTFSFVELLLVPKAKTAIAVVSSVYLYVYHIIFVLNVILILCFRKPAEIVVG